MRAKSDWSYTHIVAICLLAVVLVGHAQSAVAMDESTNWWPIQVKSYYGEYDAEGKEPGHAAPSLSIPKLEEWRPPNSKFISYTIGVAFPHLKDSYWNAVNYGIMHEADRLGLTVILMEAGGYDELDTQIKQVRQLAAANIDGLILGAISYSGNDAIIAEMEDKGIPVVEAINDVRAPAVSAKALVSFHEMGYYAGEYLVEHAEKNAKDAITVAFFPGPKASGWAPETLHGFQDALQFFPGGYSIVDVQWGDTGLETQRQLIRETLERTGPVDYIVGNAIAAQAATQVVSEMNMDEKPTIISTYLIPPLYDLIMGGKVAAAPSDLNVFQGKMAVNMLVRILQGEVPGKDFPFRSGPFIPMVTSDNIGRYPYEGLFGPRDYVPLFYLEGRK